MGSDGKDGGVSMGVRREANDDEPNAPLTGSEVSGLGILLMNEHTSVLKWSDADRMCYEMSFNYLHKGRCN